MDMITLAMAKAYSDSKGGYNKPGKAYTFDGNTDGKIVVPYQDRMNFVKISDDMPNLRNLRAITMHTNSGTNENVPVGQLTFVNVKASDPDLFGAEGKVAMFMGETPFMVVVTDTASSPIPETGLYVPLIIYDSGNTFVAYAEFDGEIVPIDQKYLPEGYGGGGLTVVEINTPASADGTPMTAEESAKMDEALAKGLPIIVKFTLDLVEVQIPISTYCICMIGRGFSFYFGADAGISFQKIEDGNWVVVGF